MPYAIHADRTRERLTIIGTDPVGLPEVLELLARQIELGAWGYGTLHDARLVTWQPTPNDIRTIVGFVDSSAETLGPRGPVAFLIRGQSGTGIARAYSHLAEASALRAEIFRDVEAADRWLEAALLKLAKRRAARSGLPES